MTSTARLTVIVGNIRASGNPPLTTAQARQDLTKVFTLAKAKNADAIHLTEIVGKWRTIVKALAALNDYNMYSSGLETILWRKDIRSAGRVGRVLTKGVPHVMTAGMLASIRLYPKGLGGRVIFAGTHLAPGWWRNPTGPSIQSRLSRTQRTRIRRVIDSKLRAGVPMILTGDMNYPGVWKFAANQTTLAKPRGLMHAYGYAPKGWTFNPVADGYISTKELHTDHPVIWATFDLTKAA